MAVLPAGRPFCPGTASVGSGPGKLALLSSRRASRRAEGRPSAGLGRGRGPGSGVESAGLPHFRGGAGTRILWIPPAGGSENYGIRLPSSDAGKSSVENGTGDGDRGDISFPTGAILTAVGTILYSGNGTGGGTFPHCGRGALPNLENPLSLLVALGGERGGWGQDPCLWSLCGPSLGTALPLL